jgi:hypothetical protein
MAMNGKADRELQFGPGRRLIEKQLHNRQLQAATPVPANAHWKINGHVVSHFFKYLNLSFSFAVYDQGSCTLLLMRLELAFTSHIR